MESLLAAVKSHPDFGKWESLRAQAKVEQAQHEVERQTEQAKEAAELAPFRAKKDALNKALNVGVASVKTWGEKKVELDDGRYAAGSHIRALVPLALAGRLHLGQITKEQYDAALAVYNEIVEN